MQRKLYFILFVFSIFTCLEAHAYNPVKISPVVIDSPEIDLLFPIYDPLDPPNFSQGLIDFDLPLNISNSIDYDANSGQYIFNSFFDDYLHLT